MCVQDSDMLDTFILQTSSYKHCCLALCKTIRLIWNETTERGLDCGERCTVLVINQLNNHHLHIHQVTPHLPSLRWRILNSEHMHMYWQIDFQRGFSSVSNQVNFNSSRKAEIYWYHLALRGIYKFSPNKMLSKIRTSPSRILLY